MQCREKSNYSLEDLISLYFPTKICIDNLFMDHSLVMVKGPSYLSEAMSQSCRDTQAWRIIVKSLTKHGPLEEEMATHSSILAWRTHEESHALQYTKSQCGGPKCSLLFPYLTVSLSSMSRSPCWHQGTLGLLEKRRQWQPERKRDGR